MQGPQVPGSWAPAFAQVALREVDGCLRGDFTSREALLRHDTVSYSAWRLIIASLVLGIAYGVCMGSYGLFRQAPQWELRLLATMLKVPLLFLLTLVVTFPSLYVFSALAGSRLGAAGILRLLVIAITVNLAVLAGFGPVAMFFTSCTKSYLFVKLLNIAMFGASGMVSLVFLRRSLNAVFEAAEPGSEGASHGDRRAKKIFVVWLFVYGVVGAQMGWVLRPFIGTPSQPFELFRDRASSFFENVLFSLRDLLL
jgi:hypothetical protein